MTYREQEINKTFSKFSSKNLLEITKTMEKETDESERLNKMLTYIQAIKNILGDLYDKGYAEGYNRVKSNIPYTTDN